MPDAPDIDVLFAELAATHPGKGRYTPMDRYRDYRAVFLGSEQGKRVLYDILSKGHLFASSAFLGGFDRDKTMFNEGERNLALAIFNHAHKEPAVMPTLQNHKAKGEE